MQTAFGTVIGAAIPIAQQFNQIYRAHEFHEKEMLEGRELFKESIAEQYKLSKEEIKKNILQQKREHLMSTYASMESHFASTDVDLVNAIRESERDMYDQRNQQLNTLILTSTVLLGVLTTILIEGSVDFPLSSDSWAITIFSWCVGMAYAMQTLTIGLCVATLHLASSYMIKKAKNLSTELRDSRRRTRKLFDDLGKEDNLIFNSDEEKIQNKWNLLQKEHRYAMQRQFDANYIYGDIEGDEGKNKIEINDGDPSTCICCEEDQSRGSSGRNVQTFEGFWGSHCRRYNSYALFFFGIGTFCQLIALCSWSWYKFFWTMNNSFATIALVGCIVLTILVGLYLALVQFRRQFDQIEGDFGKLHIQCEMQKYHAIPGAAVECEEGKGDDL